MDNKQKEVLEYIMLVIAKAQKYDRIVSVMDEGGTIRDIRKVVEDNG